MLYSLRHVQNCLGYGLDCRFSQRSPRGSHVTQGVSREVGATTTITKFISEADVALFELVTKDDMLSADEPASPDRQPRQSAPFPLLTAFLAAAAARHTSQPMSARFEHEAVRFAAPVYTDDTLSVVARVTAYDSASRSLHIHAYCHNQEGLRLAEGEFILIAE